MYVYKSKDSLNVYAHTKGLVAKVKLKDYVLTVENSQKIKYFFEDQDDEAVKTSICDYELDNGDKIYIRDEFLILSGLRMELHIDDMNAEVVDSVPFNYTIIHLQNAGLLVIGITNTDSGPLILEDVIKFSNRKSLGENLLISEVPLKDLVPQIKFTNPVRYVYSKNSNFIIPSDIKLSYKVNFQDFNFIVIMNHENLQNVKKWIRGHVIMNENYLQINDEIFVLGGSTFI